MASTAAAVDFGDPFSNGSVLHERSLASRHANSQNLSGNAESQQANVDAQTLAFLGKKDRLQRNFGFVSLVAFSTTLIASWESLACTYQSGLINGGPAALFYGVLFSWAGSHATCASLAEMASMYHNPFQYGKAYLTRELRYPTAGGQYHWTAKLAPERYAVMFSWFAGWISTFARLAVSASAAFVAASMIQGLIIFNSATYEPKEWHGLLLYWGIFVLAAFVNIVGIRAFPRVETIALVFHICSFFIILVPMIYLSPRSTATFVFTDFENTGGWESNGISWCLGLLTSAWSFVGIDATSHMSEEVQNSATVVPRAMVFAMVISGTFATAFSVALLFSIGDLLSALESPTGFPIIEVLFVATKSYVITSLFASALVLTLIFATFGTLASASRLNWAFARDNGFPFPKYFAHVSSSYYIPVRAIILQTVIAMLLGLINLGSLVAFNAMTTLALIGHYVSYLLPIGLMVYRRFTNPPLELGPYNLGRLGLPINLFAIFYSGLLTAIMVLPPYQPVTPSNMNYAGVIFGGALIFCTVMWFGYGKTRYKGPVFETDDTLDSFGKPRQTSGFQLSNVSPQATRRDRYDSTAISKSK